MSDLRNEAEAYRALDSMVGELGCKGDCDQGRRCTCGDVVPVPDARAGWTSFAAGVVGVAVTAGGLLMWWAR